MNSLHKQRLFLYCRHIFLYLPIPVKGIFWGLFTIMPALAAPLPDAGQLLGDTRAEPVAPPPTSAPLPEPQSNRPALGLPNDTLLQIQSIQITGATIFTEKQLRPFITHLEGGAHPLGVVQQAIQHIKRHYHEHGYLLAYAYLPAQAIQDGILEIHILEGKLGNLTLDNQSRLKDTVIGEQLTAFAADEVLKSDAIEKILLQLSDTPGISVRSSMRPGEQLGLTDLALQVTDTAQFSGDIDIDNYGNRYTGEYRLLGNLNIKNPMGVGDIMQIRALTTGRGLNYGRFSYQTPVYFANTQLGVAYDTMPYSLGEEFTALGAKGSARISSVFLNHSLVRSRMFNLNGQLNYTHKALNDHLAATQISKKKTLHNITFGLSGDRTDRYYGGGVTQASVNFTAGRLHLDNQMAAFDATGRQTQGSFIKAAIQVRRLQRITDQISLAGQLSGQSSNTNLDSAEQFTLGGAYGVRAYPQGEAASDEAILANLELRYQFIPKWRASVFVDAAKARPHHTPSPNDTTSTRSLSGAGIGLQWGALKNLRLQGALAWRFGAPATSTPDRAPRVWLQLIQHF